MTQFGNKISRELLFLYGTFLLIIVGLVVYKIELFFACNCMSVLSHNLRLSFRVLY